MASDGIYAAIGTGAVVYADDDRAIIVVYNGSLTFNIYVQIAPDHWLNTDCWTAGDDAVKTMTVGELYAYCAAHFAALDDGD